MASQINFKGTRWFKCDLHLHSVASACFKDRDVTDQQWVQRAIDQGLNCVAVTDHNTGDKIDAIKAAASASSLVVFPGVEITCDTSKVHLLILFDVSKGSSDVNDFLIKCGISRNNFANQEAHTSQSIFEVAEIAHKDGALVIPAHVDEYNGLGDISVANLKKFYDLEYIHAVQVVHKDFTDSILTTTGNTALNEKLNAYYHQPTPAIDDATVKKWFTPVKFAETSKLAILTFSDNPHAPGNSKHGLDGIGSRYTWFKMDELPTLEGLRQALLLPKFRVRNDFTCKQYPYQTPDLWIKSITINKSHLTHLSEPLHLEFNPQLTTIIGGRGSGKSSILRFIRGLFNRTVDISGLNEIFADHQDFYKKHELKTEKGVIKDDTTIEIQFVRNDVLHKIIASAIINSGNQAIKVEKHDPVTGLWVLETAERYIDFFQYEHYSQKQIYEIAQKPNSLKDRIDRSIMGLEELKSEKEVIKKSFLEKSASIRTKQEQLSGKGRLQTEITDLNEQIELYQQSGIASILTAKEQFASQKKFIDDFIAEAVTREESITALADRILLPDIDYTGFGQNESGELKVLFKNIVEGYQLIEQQLRTLNILAQRLKADFETNIASTVWAANFNRNETDFEAKKTELQEQGLNDILRFESLMQSRISKNAEFEKMSNIEKALATELGERKTLKQNFLDKTKEIFKTRKDYVENVLRDDKVKVSIVPFRNRTDFVSRLRTILQRQTGFDNDIEFLSDKIFNGNAESNLAEMKQWITLLKSGRSVNGLSGYFNNLIVNLSEPQFDELELLWPEDDISIQYKPSGSTTFKPLSTASAGQKTTAILTFILSQGNIPLLLDQPEDDLDNRLVYELIVDRLNQAKENRQIIVVTHNANIPVNGDAEYILSMNSESKTLSLLHAGTVEDRAIKKEICDVMEGTEYAFDMRSRRYKSIL